MSTSTAGFFFVLSLVAALAVAYRPLGDYLYFVVNGTKHSRVEGGVYRLVGVNPTAEQTWGVYARSVLAFSAVSILFLYAFQRLQDKFWLSLGFDPVPASTAGFLVRERLEDLLRIEALAALVRDREGRQEVRLGRRDQDPGVVGGPALHASLLRAQHGRRLRSLR